MLATVAVDVAANAAAGARDLFVAGASRPKALAVYDKIDAIKVKPDWAMARVGGNTFPKMLAQFEAWALQQRRRRQAGLARRHRARRRVDAAWSSRNTPPPTTTTTSSSSGR